MIFSPINLLFSYVYFNFLISIDSLTCDLSLDENSSFSSKENLLRSQCHTSTFSVRWKTRWFYYFFCCFFKETLYILIAIFIRYFFFYFSPLLPRSWTHYSSIIITTSFISEKFVIKSKYTFSFHWRAISFNLNQCFLIAHHPLTLSLCVCRSADLRKV